MDVNIRRKGKEFYYPYDKERVKFIERLDEDIHIDNIKNTNNYTYLEIKNIARLPLNCVNKIYISRILGHGDINTVFEICFGRKKDCTKTYALRLELFEYELDIDDWVNMNKLQLWLSKHNLAPNIYYSGICHGGYFNKLALDKKERKKNTSMDENTIWDRVYNI